MLAIAAFLLFVILLVYWYRIKVWVYPQNFPPGPRFPFPIFGDALGLGDGPLSEELAKLHQKHGDLVGFSLGNTPAVSIGDFDTIQEVLVKEEYSSRPPQQGWEMFKRKGYKVTNEGIGIVFSYGETCKRIHRFTLR